MRKWWQRRSLKLRLAVWFTAVASGILLGLTPVVYFLIERRLHVEFDHQLRIDWNLIEAHLESDANGRIQWRAESPAALDTGYAATWCDVWSGQEALLRHWPAHGAQIKLPPQTPKDQFGLLAMASLTALVFKDRAFCRVAVIPLLTIMAVAFFSTKLPVLLNSGFWKMAHDGRTDFSMLLGAVFLLVVGAGAWSLDALLFKSAARGQKA
jgi:hypothetical protein